ncbi:MAG: L-histidine N(alpha)-methyltransferase [Acidobacteriota bacterium]
MALNPSRRLTLIATRKETQRSSFSRHVGEGLTSSPKRLPCRYLYDKEGSTLFEEICTLPEYYLTRAETEILRRQGTAIAGLFPHQTQLVELGGGNSTKTRLLIEAFLRQQKVLHYWTVDISSTVLEKASMALLRNYSRLEITAVAAEYRSGLLKVQRRGEQVWLILWLGSNVGNLDRGEAAVFLAGIRDRMLTGDGLLIGIDLRKRRHLLERAYDDSRGVTARFNLNLLARVNRELGGHFDLTAFRHRTLYNEEAGRVEMYLVSTRKQTVRIELLQAEIHFQAGESIHTENSYKYSIDEINSLAQASGFEVSQQWLDSESQFSLNLFVPGDA